VQLLHLPGDPTAGAVAEAMPGHHQDAIAQALRRTVTWDQGVKMAGHAQIAIDAGIDI
jgi:IS30 family transposase